MLEGYISSSLEGILTKKSNLKKVLSKLHLIGHVKSSLVDVLEAYKTKWTSFAQNKMRKILQETFLPRLRNFKKKSEDLYLICTHGTSHDFNKAYFSELCAELCPKLSYELGSELDSDQILKKIKAVESLIAIATGFLSTNKLGPGLSSVTSANVRPIKPQQKPLTSTRRKVLNTEQVFRAPIQPKRRTTSSRGMSNNIEYDADIDLNFDIDYHIDYDIDYDTDSDLDFESLSFHHFDYVRISMIDLEQLKIMKAERLRKDAEREAARQKAAQDHKTREEGRKAFAREEEKMLKYIAQLEEQLELKGKKLERTDQDLKQANESLASTHKALATTTDKLSTTNKTLETTAADLKAAKEALAKLTKQNTVLTEQIKDLTAKRDALQSELQTLKETMDKAKREAERKIEVKIEEHRIQIQEKVDQHKLQMDAMAANVSSMQENTRAVMAEAEEKHSRELQEIRAKAEQEQQRLSALHLQAVEQAKLLSSELVDLQSELMRSQDAQDKMLATLNDLNAQNEELFKERQAQLNWKPSERVRSFLPSFSSLAAASNDSNVRNERNGSPRLRPGAGMNGAGGMNGSADASH